MLVAPSDVNRLKDETRTLGMGEVMGEAQGGESPSKRKQRRPPPITMTTDVGMGGPSPPTSGRGLLGPRSKNGSITRMPTVSDGNGSGTPRNAQVGPTCGTEAEALLDLAQKTAARRRKDAHPAPLDLSSLDLPYEPHESMSSNGASQCTAPANRRHLGNVAYYIHRDSATSRFVWARFSDCGRSIILGGSGQVCSGVTEFLAAAKKCAAESPEPGTLCEADAFLQKMDTEAAAAADDGGELILSVPG
jgi:hypothetical protein